VFLHSINRHGNMEHICIGHRCCKPKPQCTSVQLGSLSLEDYALLHESLACGRQGGEHSWLSSR
jgi:hypothetical protein